MIFINTKLTVQTRTLKLTVPTCTKPYPETKRSNLYQTVPNSTKQYQQELKIKCTKPYRAVPNPIDAHAHLTKS